MRPRLSLSPVCGSGERLYAAVGGRGGLWVVSSASQSGRAKCVSRRHAPANAITEATNDITILGRTSTRSSGKQKSAQPSLRAHAIAYLRGSER